jgi:hypothetical protein
MRFARVLRVRLHIVPNSVLKRAADRGQRWHAEIVDLLSCETSFRRI